jgi:hypothetical protein
VEAKAEAATGAEDKAVVVAATGMGAAVTGPATQAVAARAQEAGERTGAQGARGARKSAAAGAATQPVALATETEEGATE